GFRGHRYFRNGCGSRRVREKQSQGSLIHHSLGRSAIVNIRGNVSARRKTITRSNWQVAVAVPWRPAANPLARLLYREHYRTCDAAIAGHVLDGVYAAL